MEYLVVGLLVGALYATPSIFVGIMADKRGRSYWGWFIFSVIFTFVLAIIILLLLGDTDDRRMEKIMEEEDIRRSYRR